MRIMYLISRQFQILFNIRDMSSKGLDNNTMAQKAGVPPFAVRRNVTQAKGFTMAQLKQALRDGVELEEAVKTGRMDEPDGGGSIHYEIQRDAEEVRAQRDKNKEP